MEQISVGSSVVQYVDVNGRTDVLFVLAALARPLKEKLLPNQRLFPLNLNENDEDDLEKGRDWLFFYSDSTELSQNMPFHYCAM